MDQSQLRAIWAEIIAEAKENEKLPQEITLKEFMQETGLSRSTARDFLDRKVSMGVLQKRLYKGVNLYSPVAPSA